MEKSRQNQRIDYELKVELQAGADPGSINEAIVFETNDNRLRTVPLAMSGQIQSALTVSPEIIYVSDVKKGELVNKAIFVRGNTPFQVTGVTCEDSSVSAEVPTEKNKIQRIPLVIDTAGKTEEFTCEVIISTDLNGLSRTIKVVCNAAK